MFSGNEFTCSPKYVLVMMMEILKCFCYLYVCAKCKGNIQLIFVCDLKINLFPSLPKRSMNIFQKGLILAFFCFFQTFSLLFHEFFVGGSGLKRSNIVSGKV